MPSSHIRLAAASAALALLAPAGALADGRAQAGASLGIYSTWDLAADSSVTGTGWRDGAVVQTLDVVNDNPSGNIQVYDGKQRARVELQAQGTLLQVDGAPGLPVSGLRRVDSDLEAGTLRLQSQSSFVASPAPLDNRLAYAQGHPFAEMFQGFDVRWAKDHVGPVALQLSLTLDGVVLRNDGSDGWMAGLGVYMNLGNVATGLPPLAFPIEPVARYETGVSNQTISFGGGFINSQCPAMADYCESFVNVYAAIDLRGRSLADGSIDYSKGAASDFDFSAQLTLTSSPGVNLLRIDNLGQVLPNYAWVNPAPVPEPGSALLLAAGLAGLAWRLKRRAGCA